MSTSRQYIRRSRAQWEELVELQLSSGLSAPKFCEEAGVSYQSFMSWRKKFATREVNSNDSPKFIELTTPDNIAESEHSTSSSQWQVELDLGHGIQLRIAQH